MYFAYGCPKSYRLVARKGDRQDESVVYASFNRSDLLVCVTPLRVQLWSGGQHRIKIGELVRDEDTIQRHGTNIRAWWCPARRVIAVATTAGSLLFYGLHTTKDVVCQLPDGNEIRRVSIYLQNSVNLQVDPPVQNTPSKDRDAVADLVGDSRSVLVAMKNGAILVFSWSSELRCSASAVPILSSIAREAGILSIAYAPADQILALVFSSGHVAIMRLYDDGMPSLDQVDSYRWVYKPNDADTAAVTAAIHPGSECIALGLANGHVVMYHKSDIFSSPSHAFEWKSNNPQDQSVESSKNHLPNIVSSKITVQPLREFSLNEWGYTSSTLGPIQVLDWSPDGSVIACGYSRRGLVVWTLSGCRLMCTLRQDGILAGEDFQGGILALSWSQHGYGLVVIESSNPDMLREISFARLPQGSHRVLEPPLNSNSSGQRVCVDRLEYDDDVFVLQAADRLLLVKNSLHGAGIHTGWLRSSPLESDLALGGSQTELGLQHVCVPQNYLEAAFPVLHVAVSQDCRDIAVAGTRGVALFACHSRRWRLFGDATQETRIKAHALTWLPDGVLAVTATVDEPIGRTIAAQSVPGGHAVLLFPRHHLDFGSLLARFPLSQVPSAVDAVGNHVALVLSSDPLEITLLRVEKTTDYSMAQQTSVRGSMSLISVRELSILGGLGGLVRELSLLPPSVLGSPPGAATNRTQVENSNVSAEYGEPQHCVILQDGGVLRILDMRHGTSVTLSDQIESFWLPVSAGSAPILERSRSVDFNNITVALGPSSTSTPPAVGRVDSATALDASPAAKGAAWLERRTSNAASAITAATEGLTTGRQFQGDESPNPMEMPWWTYGPRGMQLWFPPLLFEVKEERRGTRLLQFPGGQQCASTPANEIDPELEFDPEVYPIGISFREVSIIGMVQRAARAHGSVSSKNSAASSALGGMSVYRKGPPSVSFHPHPESQPVLPCLLRRLLEQGRAADALELAIRHSKGPQFARSLEWLLFTALDADANARGAAREGPSPSTKLSSHVSPEKPAKNNGPKGNGSTVTGLQGSTTNRGAAPLLVAAARLVQQFPQAGEIVVSVARKTDVQLWPALFGAAGVPGDLCEDLLQGGALQTAACCLLIVDRVEGPSRAHSLALRLVRQALPLGSYELVADLIRFLAPPSEGDLMSPGMKAAAGRPEGSDGIRQGQDRTAENTATQQQGTVGTYASWLWSYVTGAESASTAGGGKQSSGQREVESMTVRLHRAASQAVLTSSEGAAGEEALDRRGASTATGGGGSGSVNSPAVQAWREAGRHAWKLLDSGALRELGRMNAAFRSLHGGLTSLLTTSASVTPVSLGQTTPSAAAIASALFVASNEFAAMEAEAPVAEALSQSLAGAGCVNVATALDLVLGDASRVDVFVATYPRVWSVLLELVSNDVHLCAFTSLLSPPGTPLVVTQ